MYRFKRNRESVRRNIRSRRLLNNFLQNTEHSEETLQEKCDSEDRKSQM